MKLTDVPMPWDNHPLATKPYMMERETWVTDCDGGASYEGDPLGRFETLEAAISAGQRTTGPIVIYLMRVSPAGCQHGTSVAKLWDGQLRWVEKTETEKAA